MFYFICLLNLYTNSNTIDAGLNEDTFIFISGNCQWVKQDLRWGLCFNFGDIVPFWDLRCEICEAKGWCECGPYTVEIWPQWLGLWKSDFSVSCRVAKFTILPLPIRSLAYNVISIADWISTFILKSQVTISIRSSFN